MIQGLVDTQRHTIVEDRVRHPPDPIGGRQSDRSATSPVTHRQPTAATAAAGVPQAVVEQSAASDGRENRRRVESVAAHAGRLAGAFPIDPPDADSPRAIRHWHGLSGFRLFSAGATMAARERVPA